MGGPQDQKPKYAEFFAGGGLVSAALAPAWECLLANDIDAKKCLTYRANFPDHPLVQGDIATLDPGALSGPVDLYWASSPCQDFSLAGRGQGLRGARSSTFSHFADILDRAAANGSGPRIVAFENVVGLVSRQGSRDFHTVLRRIAAAGYRVGALEIDAVKFLPHSRPRLFVIAVRDDVQIPKSLVLDQPGPFHSRRVQAGLASAPRSVRERWVWWHMPEPLENPPDIAALIETGADQDWFAAAQLARLTALMPPLHADRLQGLMDGPGPSICFAYKRGRPDGQGRVRQVAELRFDGNAGCIRTPAGGSSRQIVLIAGDGRVRARLLNPREAARLLGLSDTYLLPERFNDAYKIAGDGVAVPVVRHLDRHLFQPLLRAARLDIAA